MSRPRRVQRGHLIAGSEDAFAQAVQQLAGFEGWLRYHTHRSDRSAPGFPDEVYVRGPRLVFAELKKVGATPRATVADVATRPEWLRHRAITNAQAAWLEALRTVEIAVAHATSNRVFSTAEAFGATIDRPAVEVYVWTPDDWPTIQRVLARNPRGPAHAPLP